MTPSHDSLEQLTAVILAGGEGRRLRPVIGEHQKVVAPVNGRPFLSFVLDRLQAAGIRSVVLCVGFDADAVQRAFGVQYGNMRIRYAGEEQPMGTAGALRRALALIDSDPALVLNGDSICEVDLNDFHARHMARGAAASLVLARVDDASRYGSVRLADDDAILGFVEKSEAAAPGWISAGIYLLARAVISDIAQGRPVSIEKEVFPSLVGRRFFGHRTHGRFIDIGTPRSFAEAPEFMSGGGLPIEEKDCKGNRQ